jgi:hypothetical protein
LDLVYQQLREPYLQEFSQRVFFHNCGTKVPWPSEKNILGRPIPSEGEQLVKRLPIWRCEVLQRRTSKPQYTIEVNPCGAAVSSGNLMVTMWVNRYGTVGDVCDDPKTTNQRHTAEHNTHGTHKIN